MKENNKYQKNFEYIDGRPMRMEVNKQKFVINSMFRENFLITTYVFLTKTI